MQIYQGHFSSIQSFSHVWLFGNPWTAACQASCPLSTPGACSNSCQSRRWCHPTISSSAAHFCSCLQSIPESGSFPMSQFFASDGQRIGVPASASGLPMTIQDWFPLGLTGLISLLSKGLSRVFSKTTVQKHKFFDAVLFLFLFLFYSPTLKSIMTTEKAIALCLDGPLLVVSSAYLKLLIFLPAILISACASSSLAFIMMYFVYKLNKQGENIQPWHTLCPIWNWSIVSCPVLTVASWPEYRFFSWQVRWSGIPMSWRISHSLLWSIQAKALG